MKQTRMIGFIILGIIFLVLAAYYFITPANALVSFIPGYDANSAAAHTKHGLAALLLAIGCSVMAWFSLGKKSSGNNQTPPTER